MKLTVVGFNFKTDIPFMNAAERSEFRRLLDGGLLTFYDTAICEVCGKKIIKGKTFCSKACFEHHEKERDTMEEIEGLIGSDIELETVDAIRRKGKLTKINWAHVEVNDKKAHFPRTIELNDDSVEAILWGSLKWIREV